MGKGNNKRNYLCRYTKKASIIAGDNRQELELSDDEVVALYRFYVIESPVEEVTLKSRSFNSRGWDGRMPLLNKMLTSVLDISTSDFVIKDLLDDSKADSLIKGYLASTGLGDGPCADLSCERAVLIGTRGNSKREKLLRHVRNCLCHGNFKLLNCEELGEPVFVMEDRTIGKGSNVTARMVLKKSTLLEWARIVCSKEIRDEGRDTSRLCSNE